MSRINQLEQRHRITATCRACNGKGRWVAEYQDDRFAAPMPRQYASTRRRPPEWLAEVEKKALDHAGKKSEWYKDEAEKK